MVLLFELIAVLTWVILIATQILIPLFAGTSLFPAFRRKKSLSTDLRAAQESVYAAETESQIQDRLNTAEDIRSKISKSKIPKKEQK